jgi:hypothetical protein
MPNSVATSGHNGTGRARGTGPVPVCEIGQQWPMSKLFGAAVTTAEVPR